MYYSEQITQQKNHGVVHPLVDEFINAVMKFDLQRGFNYHVVIHGSFEDLKNGVSISTKLHSFGLSCSLGIELGMREAGLCLLYSELYKWHTWVEDTLISGETAEGVMKKLIGYKLRDINQKVEILNKAFNSLGEFNASEMEYGELI